VLSVPIDRDRRLGSPAFGSAPRLADSKKAGKFKRGPGTVVPSCGIQGQLLAFVSREFSAAMPCLASLLCSPLRTL
jgi:hypothetical protein